MRVLLASLGLAVVGCGSADFGSEKSTSLPTADGRGTTTEMGGPSEGGSSGSASPTTGGGSGGAKPGTLTAGAWDDNANYDFYLSYLDKHASLAGALKAPRADRLRVDVVDGAGLALGGARVVVRASDKVVFDGPSATDGHVDVYPKWAGAETGAKLTVEATLGSISATASALAGDKTVKLALSSATATIANGIDVAIVIDTTGSMGDEISFLRTEVAAIAARVGTTWPSASQRWAVVAYKDKGDSYVVKTAGFASDPAVIQSELTTLSADGGGDYPEAPDQALAEAAKLPWRTGNLARMVFWIADAPHHPGTESTIAEAVTTMRAKGVHVYPVAASGVDELAEHTMRSAAQLTSGRYLFLTDDSGVGGAHKEPSIPCYFVTKLDNAMVRMIATELTGTYVGPTSPEVIRTGGDPRDGRCTLANGQQVAIF